MGRLLSAGEVAGSSSSASLTGDAACRVDGAGGAPGLGSGTTGPSGPVVLLAVRASLAPARQEPVRA